MLILHLVTFKEVLTLSKSKRRLLVILLCLILIFTPLYIYSHSTPERAIRSMLFYSGHFKSAFTTEIYKLGNDPDYGEQYSCRSPKVGPQHITLYKSEIGLWHINRSGSGEG